MCIRDRDIGEKGIIPRPLIQTSGEGFFYLRKNTEIYTSPEGKQVALQMCIRDRRFDVKSHRDDWGGILNFGLTGKRNHFSIGAEYKEGSVDGGDHYVTSPDKVLNLSLIHIW